eukprot:GDKI01025580.1.p1 GENE.GDKI01025580.1~~GDKI01025580.1.p1  ORF type:complete len:389 (-),score=69.61 GDKI01025580.1:23-1189(-)
MGKNKKEDFAYSGIAAGVITKTLCAPLDRLRLLYQLQGMFEKQTAAAAAGHGIGTAAAAASSSSTAAGRSNHGAYKYSNIGQAFRQIVKEEGVVGLWRGNGANMLRAAVVYTLKFGTNDLMKQRFVEQQQEKNLQNTQNTPESIPIKHAQPNDALGLDKLLLSGFVAGSVQKALSYPLDLVSVRIALGANNKQMNAGGEYKGIIDCTQRIWRTEGLTGFWKGITPTLLTGVPYVMLQMTFFELYQREMRKILAYVREHPAGLPGGVMSLVSSDTYSIGRVSSHVHASEVKPSKLDVFLSSSVAGSLAALTAQTIVFPGDTVRKRMMANGADGSDRVYKSMRDCFRQIYRKEGVRVFYHGLGPTALKAVPSGAIQFGCYELLKSIFANR